MFKKRHRPSGIRPCSDQASYKKEEEEVQRDEAIPLEQKIQDLKYLQQLRVAAKGVDVTYDVSSHKVDSVDSAPRRQLLTESFHGNRDQQDPSKEHFEKWIEEKIGAPRRDEGNVGSKSTSPNRELYEIPSEYKTDSSIRALAQKQPAWIVGLQEVPLAPAIAKNDEAQAASDANGQKRKRVS